MKKSILSLGALLAFGIASAQVDNPQAANTSRSATSNRLTVQDNNNRNLSTGTSVEPNMQATESRPVYGAPSTSSAAPASSLSGTANGTSGTASSNGMVNNQPQANTATTTSGTNTTTTTPVTAPTPTTLNTTTKPKQ